MNSRPYFNKATSLYLDLVRAFAALTVFFYHARFNFSHGQWWLPQFGREMVIVFFVLSGFVITYVADKNPDSAKGFAADRLSRLYSVILPALLLTAVLDRIGSHFAPALYAGVIRADHYWPRMALAGVFLNQSWMLSSNPGSNEPLWSLAYEFWYYVLFAGCFFARGWLRKGLVITAFVLATGYRIALLLPVWLMGIASYCLCRRQSLSARTGAVLSVTTLLAIGLIMARVILLPGPGSHGHPQAPLFFSGWFVADFLLGLLVAAHFVGTDAMIRRWRPPDLDRWWCRAIRFTAARSFSLYAFHRPVMVFLKAVMPFDGGSPIQVIAVLLLTLAVILGVSEFTERRRDTWRRLFRWLLGVRFDKVGG